MYVQTCTIVYFKLSSTIMTVSSGLIKVGLQGGTMEQIMCSVYLHKLILAMGYVLPHSLSC